MNIKRKYGLFDIPAFKEALNKKIQKKKLKQNSAKTYVSALEILNEQCEEGATSAEIKKKIYELAPGSAWGYIAGIQQYENSVIGVRNSIVRREDMLELQNHYQKLRAETIIEPKYRLETYLKKLDKIKRSDIKLLHLLQLQSGLRIAEMCDLKPEDITFKNKHIHIHVRKGKGNKERYVTCRYDVKLYNLLLKYIKEEYYLRNNRDGYLFPKKASIITYHQENKTGLERTHDFRRYNARLRFEDAKGRGFNDYESREIVKKALGHESVKDTNKYLGKIWKKKG